MDNGEAISETKSLTDRLFPLDDSPGSSANSLDLANLVDDAVATVVSSASKCSQSNVSMSAVSVDDFECLVSQRKPSEFWKMLGLQAPPSNSTLKVGPNGFAVETLPDGTEVETDQPNILLINAAFLQQKSEERLALEQQAMEEKAAAKAAKIAAKAEAKLKTKAAAKTVAKAKAKSKAKAKAKSKPAVVNVQDSSTKHYSNLKIASASTGIIRTYITGVSSVDNKRHLITELTEKTT